MGRPRLFDDEKALDSAAACFWARGYEATSVRDLSECMGMAGASLYHAYGGKRALFEAALERYCSRSMRERIARLEESASGLAAIDSFFEDVIERSLTDSDKKGCFLVNAALEVAPHDPGIAKAISGYLAELTAFFRRNIAAAQTNGETPLEVDSGLYAAHLLSVLFGLRVLARCSPEGAFLHAAAAPALRRLHHSSHASERTCR